MGIDELREIECSGRVIVENVDVLSITLYRTADNFQYVNAKVFKSTCKTFRVFSACTLDQADSRESSVRTLLSGLNRDKSVMIGCNLTAVLENGLPRMFFWSIPVRLSSEFCLISVSLSLCTKSFR